MLCGLNLFSREGPLVEERERELTFSVLHLRLLLARPLFDLNVAKMQDSSDSPEQLHLFFHSELKDLHSILGRREEGTKEKDHCLA